MSDVSEAKWYVIHTFSGYENKVLGDLEKMVENRGMQDLIFELSIPTETVTEIKDNVTKEVERKIFPGYVLIKMIVTDDSWYLVRNTHGVTGFVGPGSKPVPLTEEEVMKLGVEKHTVELEYSVGDTVRIIDGPLADFSGVVQEIETDKNYVRVNISMFGKDTPVELQLDQIELDEED